jgi:hypothetical protein
MHIVSKFARDCISEKSAVTEKLHETLEKLDFHTKSVTHFPSSFIEVKGNV